MTIDGFDIFAFVVFAVLLAATVVIIVLLGALPGKIAVRRCHPQAAAVNAAAWISMVTLSASGRSPSSGPFCLGPCALSSDVAAKEGGRVQ